MASTVDAYTRPERPRPRSSFFTRDFLLALPFLALLYIQLAHHVLWRDELNALAITWASPTIPSLFWHIHHEGHPWLWYVILWIPSRFTQSVLVLKIVQGIISTAIILFVAFRSPFRTWEKVLILSGYFFLFEYTVLSRMYGVMLLLFVVYLWRRTTRPEEPDRQRGAACPHCQRGYARYHSVVCASAGVCVHGVCAAPHSAAVFPEDRDFGDGDLCGDYVICDMVSQARKGHQLAHNGTAVQGREGPLSSLRGVPELHDPSVSAGEESAQPLLLEPMASPRRPGYLVPMLIFVLMLYWSFRGRWNLLMMIGVTIVAGTLFGHLIYLGSERHFGVVFLAFMAAAWIVRADIHTALWRWPIYALLGLSSLASVWAVIGSWTRPFSHDKAAAGMDRAEPSRKYADRG